MTLISPGAGSAGSLGTSANEPSPCPGAGIVPDDEIDDATVCDEALRLPTLLLLLFAPLKTVPPPVILELLLLLLLLLLENDDDDDDVCSIFFFISSELSRSTSTSVSTNVPFISGFMATTFIL